MNILVSINLSTIPYGIFSLLFMLVLSIGLTVIGKIFFRFFSLFIHKQKKEESKKPAEEKRPKKPKVARSIEINPDEIDKIYVKK